MLLELLSELLLDEALEPEDELEELAVAVELLLELDEEDELELSTSSPHTAI